MTRAWSVAAALVTLTLAMTWPLAARLTTSVPGDYGDPLLVMWAMGWVSRQLTMAAGDPSALSGFWNANIFHPEPQALAFSEHFIGQTLLTLPVSWLGGSLLLAYNVAFLATFVLSALGMFLLARALTGSALAGLVAGVVMAFNEYRLQYEVAHLHVLSIHWLPFVVLGLHRYLASDSLLALAGGVLALLLLNLSSVYYMAYCAPFIAAFVVFEAVRLKRWRRPRVWLELWAAGAATVVVMLPFLFPYLDVQRRYDVVRGPEELAAYSATLDHYRLALPGLIVPGALALAALVPVRGRVRYPLTLALLVGLIASMWLSLGPVVQSSGQALGLPALYPLLHEHLPGYSGLRVPARFATLFFFFLALLAGIGALRVSAWAPRHARAIVAAGLVVYLVQARPSPLPLDQPLPSPGLLLPPASLTPSGEVPPLYREVDLLPSDAVLLELPFGDPWYDLRYMFFAASHGRRLVNGYSGVFPPSYRARQAALAAPLADPAAAHRALSGATHVVVHPGAWPDDTGVKIAAWLETLGASLLSTAPDGDLLYQIDTTERLAGW